MKNHSIPLLANIAQASAEPKRSTTLEKHLAGCFEALETCKKRFTSEELSELELTAEKFLEAVKSIKADVIYCERLSALEHQERTIEFFCVVIDLQLPNNKRLIHNPVSPNFRTREECQAFFETCQIKGAYKVRYEFTLFEDSDEAAMLEDIFGKQQTITYPPNLQNEAEAVGGCDEL